MSWIEINHASACTFPPSDRKVFGKDCDGDIYFGLFDKSLTCHYTGKEVYPANTMKKESVTFVSFGLKEKINKLACDQYTYGFVMTHWLDPNDLGLHEAEGKDK
jgi:hypothetical protein